MSKVKSPGSKNVVRSPKAIVAGVSGRTCVFCEQTDNDEDHYGKLLSKAGLSAHYFCMLFSSGLSQNGKSEKQGILGFLPNDIMREVKRGSRLRCSYCRKGGATIGCVVRNCKKMFHLGCGQQNGTLHLFFDTFSSYCQVHRPQQNVPAILDSSYVCSICMTSVECKPSADTLRAPCCRKAWYHRSCLQNYARSAGLYFFKCPLCNNKDEFQMEMLTYGIYIPDQDASWETEPHAFQELLERYQHCDAETCRSSEGRKYDKEGRKPDTDKSSDEFENRKWELLICDNCGSAGGHVACGHLIKKGKDYICPECHEVDLKYFSPEKKLTPKRKLLEACGLEDDAPAEKQAREVPGPSNRMRKTGLPCVVSTSPDGRALPASPQRKPPRNREGLPTALAKKRRRLSVSTELDNVKKQRLKSPNKSDLKPAVSPSKRTVPVIDITTETKTKRLSLEDFKDGTLCKPAKDKKKVQKKRHSLQPGTSQKTLEGWLKLGTFKPKEKSPTTADNEKKVSNIFTKNSTQKLNVDNSNICIKKTPIKRPAVVEYMGEKLEIKSPRVLLHKNIDISGNLKPRVLELTPKIDGISPSTATGKALLADLDNDFRVTRKMVSSADRSPCVDPNIDLHSSKQRSKRKTKRNRKTKHSSCGKEMAEYLSEDELTPKSRENLLKSTEKKKLAPLLENTPKSSVSSKPVYKGLQSSGKKRQLVSSRDLWNLSNNNDPIPPLSAVAEEFFSVKGVLDENCNNTLDARSGLNQDLCKPVTSVSPKPVSQISTKSKTSDLSSSPVLRSCKTSAAIVIHTPEKRSETDSPVLRSRKFSKDVPVVFSTVTPEKKSGIKNNSSESLFGSHTPEKRSETDSPVLRSRKFSKDVPVVFSTVTPEKSRIKNNSSDSLIVTHTPEKRSETDSPVLRSRKFSKDVPVVFSTVTPEKKSGIKNNSSESEITLAPGYLNDLYNINEFKEHLLENAVPHTHKNKQVIDNGDGVSLELSLRESVAEVLELTPKRKTSSEETPPITRRSTKSLSELKSYKRNVNSKSDNEEHPKTDIKMRRKTIGAVKTRNSNEILKASHILKVEEINDNFFSADSSSGRVGTSSSVRKSGTKKQRRNTSLGTGEQTKNENQVVTELFQKIETVSEGSLSTDGLKNNFQKTKCGINVRLECGQGKKVSDAAKLILKSYISKKKEPSKQNPKGELSKNLLEKKIDGGISEEKESRNTLNSSVDGNCLSDAKENDTCSHNDKNRTEKVSSPVKLTKNQGTEETLLDFVNTTVTKLFVEKEKIADEMKEMAEKNSGSQDLNRKFVDVLEDEAETEDSTEKVHWKRGSKKIQAKNPEKTKANVTQVKGSLEIFKMTSERSSEKSINSAHTCSSSCENTCPNPQPVLKKCQGSTILNSVPLSQLQTEDGKQNQLTSQAKADSPTMMTTMTKPALYNRISAWSCANKDGKLSGFENDVGDYMTNKEMGIPVCMNPLLKLRSTNKEMQVLTDRIKKSAGNIHSLSRTGSRLVDKTLKHWHIGLSPQKITRFTPSTDTFQNLVSSEKQTQVDSVQREFHVLENLEATGGEIPSDKLAMSEYYSAPSIKSLDPEIDIDLDDIRPLTDICIK